MSFKLDKIYFLSDCFLIAKQILSYSIITAIDNASSIIIRIESELANHTLNDNKIHL